MINRMRRINRIHFVGIGGSSGLSQSASSPCRAVG